MIEVYNLPSGPIMTNTYLVFEEDTKKGFLVDPGGYNKEMKKLIESNNVDLEYIILTHGHGDHIGGVEGHKEDTGAKVVASKLELPVLKDPRLNLSPMTEGRGITVEPDLLVEDGENLTIGNMKLQFFSTPGHTQGGMCVLVEDKLFSGDTLFRTSIGRTDFPGGSFDTLINSIKEKIFVLEGDIKVYPGHMGETTIAYEKENNPFV